MLLATLELLAEVGFDGMSIDAIAARAKVGKTTIYRRYTNKEELVADALDKFPEEIIIPDTGTLWGDLEALIQNIAQITLNPLGRQIVAMIISHTSTNPQFAQIYWTKYLQPRREAFVAVIERAKARREVRENLDPLLAFDSISGMMLYTLVFPVSSESWENYSRRALRLVLGITPTHNTNS
ncbi:TetR/AcrR family transcriptional regulator [Chroococcus sp. FPU101]|uniref:TetR/AcrR family transcriptional regulator n=1 Tax=Chroococcus sp. FPU101 TaxID=1974212 RepID=UPI001AA657E5|nr:TetR/AcrR family transcriptional regulator [Chroococcus sp. FPU101]GFE69585.1 transcriptional regulator, TetR family [Chroococcus sp. FPU101]